MSAVSIKKLVAGFLVLAAALVASGFLLQGAERAPGMATVLDQTPEASAPANAFVESLPVDAPGSYRVAQNLLPAEVASGTSSDNLTEKLVAVLGDELGKANPNGPTESGGLALPDADGIINALTNTDNIAALHIPDWESEISFQYKPHLIAGANPADIAAYQKARDEFFRTHLNINTSDGAELSRAVAAQKVSFNPALAAVEKIPVPEPLAEYHWSLIKLMAYQERANGLLLLSNNDPLRASLIANVQEQNYFAAITQYEQKLQRATALGLLQPADQYLAIAHAPITPTANFINIVLGIKTAHAIFGIGDIHFDPILLARTVWQYIKKAVTEKLKDRLVHQLVAQTITWIQGGGKPQFVTDWKGFLANTAKDQASRMIDRIAPQLCSSFGPLIRVAVLPVDPSRDFSTACSLDQIIGNVTAFADSFENGGWIAYGAALQPSNNFFGSLIQTNEVLQASAAAARKAKKSDITAGKGFKPQQTCVKDGVSPYEACLAEVRKQCTAQGMSSEACNAVLVDLCGSLSDVATCDQWENTTPGSMLYASMDSSIKAPLQRIVNAQDSVALLNALINAALDKLTKLGKSVVSKGILGIDTRAPYIPPPQGVDSPTSTSGTPGAGFPFPATCGVAPDGMCVVNSAASACTQSVYRDAVVGAIDQVIAADLATGVIFDFSNMDNGDPAIRQPWSRFHEAMRDVLVGQGFLVAINLAAGDEIAIRKSNDIFAEYFDIIRGDGFVRRFHVATCLKAASDLP